MYMQQSSVYLDCFKDLYNHQPLVSYGPMLTAYLDIVFFGLISCLSFDPLVTNILSVNVKHTRMRKEMAK